MYALDYYYCYFSTPHFRSYLIGGEFKMNKINTNALVEGLKELIRTALMAVVPLVISALSSGEGAIDWRAIAIAGVIALLSGVDKILHKKGVETPLDLESLDALKK